MIYLMAFPVDSALSFGLVLPELLVTCTVSHDFQNFANIRQAYGGPLSEAIESGSRIEQSDY